MLDQQHRHLLEVAHAADLRFEHVDLVVVEAGGGLVEQQQLRARGERAGQLDALADRERQRARRHQGEGLDVHEFDQLPRPLGDALLLRGDARQSQRRWR